MASAEQRYTKLSVVGRGQFGVVSLARRVSVGGADPDRRGDSDKLVILKQISLEGLSASDRQNALNEVKVLSILQHPNIIQRFEHYIDHGTSSLTIVMEYAADGTLADYIMARQDKLIDEDEVMRIFSQLCLALHYIHKKQILHRDLKPQNVLICGRMVKLCDFGISTILTSRSKATSIVGTPYYLAPELCSGRPYYQSSDIWSAGCILYEMLTLRKAFDADNLAAVVRKIIHGHPQCAISSKYCADITDLVQMMLSTNPSLRPSISHILAVPQVFVASIKVMCGIGRIERTHERSSPADHLLTVTAAASNDSSLLNASDLSDDVFASPPTKPAAQNDLTEVFYFSTNGELAQLPVPGKDQIVAVSIGRYMRLARTAAGDVVRWISRSRRDDISYQKLSKPLDLAIVQIDAGDRYCCAVTDRGLLLVHGAYSSGCLATTEQADITSLAICQALLGERIVKVRCGASHAAALTDSGVLYAWGVAKYITSRSRTTRSLIQRLPFRLDFDFPIADMWLGGDCTIVKAQSQQVLVLGSNIEQKLMKFDPTEQQTSRFIHEFESVDDLKSVSLISVGHRHLTAWRDSSLSFQGSLDTHTPVEDALSLCSGENISVVLTAKGDLMGFGDWASDGSRSGDFECIQLKLKGRKVISVSVHNREMAVVVA